MGTGFAWFGKFITGTFELSGNRFDPFFRGVFCLKYCLIFEIELDDLPLSINSTEKSLVERERRSSDHLSYIYIYIKLLLKYFLIKAGSSSDKISLLKNKTINKSILKEIHYRSIRYVTQIGKNIHVFAASFVPWNKLRKRKRKKK